MMAELGPGVQHFARRLRDRHLLRYHRQHHHPLRHPLQAKHADPAELLHREPGHLWPAPLLHDDASHTLGSFKVWNITKCASDRDLSNKTSWVWKRTLYRRWSKVTLGQGSQTCSPPDVFMRPMFLSKFLQLLLKLQLKVVLEHFAHPFVQGGDIFASLCGLRALFLKSKCGLLIYLSLRPLL